MILLDTNLLTRQTDTSIEHGRIARDAIYRLESRNEQLVIVPQNLYEFWAVATRTIGPKPKGENGLGLTIEEASQWISFFRERFSLFPDRDDLPVLWFELVKAKSIKGFRSHDARLVAAMQSYGITRLLTFNVSDFQGLGIAVIEPATV